MAAHALRIALVGLALALSVGVAGCTSTGPREQTQIPVPTAPTRGHVYGAVQRLGTRLHSLYRTWPAHLARSAEDTSLPLVELREVENKGKIKGADLEALGWELAQQLRTQGKIRLLSDEANVVAAPGEGGPPQLEAGTKHNEAGLVLYPWIDKAGRFCVVLQDEVKDKALAVARSDAPKPVTPKKK